MILTWLKMGRERILAIGWRLALYQLFNWVYDNPVYIWAFHSLGVGRGWALMTVGSLLSCAYLFWRYDRGGVDWLFAKAVREWEGKGEQSRFEKWMSGISRSRNGRFGFLWLALANISLDPLVVAVHFKQSHFKGISAGDWGTLVSSVAVANLYWGLRIGLLVKILEWAYGLF